MSRTYNFIYRELVSDENDVVGHVAYALYKSSKIEYIEKFKQEHGGKQPSESELLPFHQISCTASSIDRYKTKAAEITRDFLDATLTETVKQIESDYVESQDRHLESIIEPLKPMGKARQFWGGVLQSVLGAFFFAIIVAAFAFITSYNKSDDSVKAGTQMEQAVEQNVQQMSDSLRQTAGLKTDEIQENI